MKNFLYFIIIAVLLFGSYFWYVDNRQNIKIEEDIYSHYNKYVKTNKDAKLYEFSNNNYFEIGLITENNELELEEILEYNDDNIYFKILNLDYYIKYTDVEKIEKLSKNNSHYKNYVLFNENIITNDETNFYNADGLVYKIKKNFDLPIIIKDDDKYYVEYNNRLLYVKKEEIKYIEKRENTTLKTKESIRPFAYHFVYKENDECTNDYICHPYSQFDEHIKYLSDNDYFSLNCNDLMLFLEGKIRIPEKSVMITLDDGHLAKNAIEILDKYQIRATYFVITSWYDPTTLESEYVELQSHTHNMHNNYKCNGGNQGGQLLCEKEDLILNDINVSIEKLNNAFAIAYPFYDYNQRLIDILKNTNIKMGFIGVENMAGINTNGIAYPGINLYEIPRLTLSAYTTLDEFISYLK